MFFVNNGQDNKKDSTNITLWRFQKKGHYANDLPYKNTKTGTNADTSRQSDSANPTNGIRYATFMIQEGVNGGEFDGYDVFSALYFFNAGHEHMKPEEEHPQL